MLQPLVTEDGNVDVARARVKGRGQIASGDVTTESERRQIKAAENKEDRSFGGSIVR